MKIKNILVMH